MHDRTHFECMKKLQEVNEEKEALQKCWTDSNRLVSSLTKEKDELKAAAGEKDKKIVRLEQEAREQELKFQNEIVELRLRGKEHSVEQSKKVIELRKRIKELEETLEVFSIYNTEIIIALCNKF